MAQPITLTLTNISYIYPSEPDPLFENVSASFPRGWTAVLGDNGIGKTTLMSIATGALAPTRGVVTPSPRNLICAYCRQETDLEPDNLYDFAADWSPETTRVRNALRIGDDWAYRYGTLSGGEAKRLQIACALALRPDVLVLDEPTNHVDVATRSAIAEAMHQYHGIGMVVSHDVPLIDATCERCIMFERRHVKGRNITVAETYSCGYTRAAEQMDARDLRDEDSLRSARHELARLRAARVQRGQAMRSAEARKHSGRSIDPRDHSALDHHKWVEKQSDKASAAAYRLISRRVDRARQTLDSLSTASKRYDGDIWIDICPSGRKELVRLPAGFLAFGTTRVDDETHGRNPAASVLRVEGNRWMVTRRCAGTDGGGRWADGIDIPSLSIGPRDHIALTGPNGSGKTTVVGSLLAALDGEPPCLFIAQQIGETTRRGVMDRFARLDDGNRSTVLGLFARLNADPDRLLASARPSPGELRKLMLCLGIMDKPRLIVMDEPTNHLDLDSKRALARCLADYPGAMLIVSHDEWFLGQALGGAA